MQHMTRPQLAPLLRWLTMITVGPYEELFFHKLNHEMSFDMSQEVPKTFYFIGMSIQQMRFSSEGLMCVEKYAGVKSIATAFRRHSCKNFFRSVGNINDISGFRRCARYMLYKWFQHVYRTTDTEGSPHGSNRSTTPL